MYPSPRALLTVWHVLFESCCGAVITCHGWSNPHGAWYGRYDLVHSPVAYCLGIPSLENIADTFAGGELRHVHRLVVEEDSFYSPENDVRTLPIQWL
jgi:hypothetical protein